MLASLRYTCDFVRNSLPGTAKRILEVGCGSGELAALLTTDGVQVTAIDADVDCVAKAQAIGVDAKLVTWPVPVDQRFDAVLFTRSLHHVGDLPASVVAAREALHPGGRIIVEDFRAEGGSERSSRWFETVVRDLHGSGALSPDTTVAALLDKALPSSSHEHHLHSSAAIRRALSTLDSVLEEDAAYYFRYLEPHLTSDAAADELLQLELSLIAKGSIEALGKRFVAGRR